MQNRKIRVQAWLIAAAVAALPMSAAAQDPDPAATENFADATGDAVQSIGLADAGTLPGGSEPVADEEKEPASEEEEWDGDGLGSDVSGENRRIDSLETPVIYDLTDETKLKVRIKSGQQSYLYTGSEIEPEIEVVYVEETDSGNSEKVLGAGHFHMDYQDNIHAGTATVTVIGKDSDEEASGGASSGERYTGSRTLHFTIAPAPVSSCKIAISNASYTGKAVTPAVTATYNGEALVEGVDYQASFSDNKAIGTAAAVISGIGDFTGTVSNSFKVRLASPSLKAKAKSYNTIKLTWNKPKAADGYQIQRSTSAGSGFKTIKKYSSGSRKSYANRKVTCGKTYYYRIRSYAKIKVRKNGKTKTKTVYSPWSAVAEKATTLGTVKIKSAEGSSKTSVRITWKRCAGAQGYEIYRSTTQDGVYELAGTGKGTSYIDKELEENSIWYYKVRAFRKSKGKKTYGGFSKVKEGKVKESSSSSSIYDNDKLAELFPDGVPTTAAAMQPYLAKVEVPIKVLKSDKVTMSSGTLTLTVHKDLKDKIYAAFLDMYNINFPITSGTYCYSWRDVTGSSSRSHHSYGVAIDINPASNPMVGYTSGTYAPGTDPYSVTPAVIAIWEKYGFYWGGNFKRAKDYMHFSYTGY